jgi:hypothetical protein
MVETFFKTLKAELVWRTIFQSRIEAASAIGRYIDGFYNPVRGGRQRRVDETERYAQCRSTRPAASIGRTRQAKAGRPPRTGSHSAKHHA